MHFFEALLQEGAFLGLEDNFIDAHAVKMNSNSFFFFLKLKRWTMVKYIMTFLINIFLTN